MKNILTILSLFISVNFYSQIIHPQDGTNIKELFCGQSVPYFDPGGQQGNYYPNVMSEQQFIVPSGGHVIQIDFNNLFDVKSDGTGGCEDYIEVYDGAIGGGGTLIGIYCNILPPGIITSTGNAITVKFYSDGANNHQGWVATVTAVDILSPQGSDPSPISVQCIGDVPPADVSVVTDESDNCGPPSVTHISDATDGNHCPETITRTYRINDVIGNFIDVYQTITIHDVTAPVMGSAPADTVIACKSDMPGITNLSYDDNCDGDGMVSGSDVSNGNTCPEIVTRTWTYVDACGNVGTETQVFTINDVEAPTASNPTSINVECLADAPSPDVLVVNDEFDACDTALVVAFADDSIVGNAAGLAEAIIRTYSITDDCGNFTTVEQTINIIDTQNPQATSPVDLNVECLSDVPLPNVSVISDETDNCTASPVVAFVSDISDGLFAPETITRTYSVADEAGNTTIITQIITINDVTSPTASSPTAINVECAGDIPSPDVLVIADETDNCTASPVVAFVSDISDGLFAPETITRTYSVTDEAGNSTSITQTIIINDVTNPGIFNCPSDEVIISSLYDPNNPLFGDNCDLEHIYWTMTGATNNASPTAGIHYVGLESFNDGITTITYAAEDSSGNTATCSFTVTANLINCTLAASAVSSNASCFGASDGSIDVTTAGGAIPISYQWNSGDVTEDLIGVVAGTYSLTIIDNEGCDTTFITTVSEPSVIELSINSNDPSCGDDDGVAFVTVLSGGASPFSYSWTNGASTSQADSLSTGIYSVQVTDDAGCSVSSTVIINNWNGPNILLNSSQEPSCFGDSDGTIDITAVGGAGSYSYIWSEGSTTEDISGLISGTYDVTLQDANGCETTESFTVNDPILMDLSNTNITEASCGGFDGGITVTVTGGAGNYNYQWEAAAGNATVNSVSGLTAGAYALTVADANGCIATMTYSINNVGGPIITEDLIIQPTCTGGGTGSIDVSITGGSAPYGYSWDSGQVSEDISGITPGDYQLTVTDNLGCAAIYIGTVDGIIPLGEDICLVTVDTITGTNLVVWTKTDTAGISHYNIYREGNSTGLYALVGTNPVSVLSQWLDPTANPSIKSWRYKISAVDSCGNESYKSPSHKTMHVTSNIGLGGVVNVFWDYYDGFSYGSYYISRYTASTGWVPIDTVVSTATSWTDISPPNLIDVEYMIQVQPSSTCTATKAQDHNTTRSNRHTTVEPNPQGTIDLINNSFSLYPNPTNGLVTILLSENPVNSWSVRITDLAGKLLSQSLEKGATLNLDLSFYDSGIYLIEINVNGMVRIEKVIIQ